MPAVHRAFLYITRKKGKSILLLGTFLIIMILLLTGLTINHAATTTAAQLRENIGGYFKVTPDYRKMNRTQVVTAELIQQIMQQDGIKSYNAMDTHYLMLPDLTLSPGKFTAEQDHKARMTRFLANTDSSLHEYFVLNILTLEEGRHIQPRDQHCALISQAMAEANQLRVGDSIPALLMEGETIREDIGYDFEIVGIFAEVHPEDGNPSTPECDLPVNFVFTDEKTGQALTALGFAGDEQSYNTGAAFFAKDPKDLDEIAGKVEQLDYIDWNSLQLTVNNSAYMRSVQPLNRLSGMTSLMIGLIAVISIILLSLLLMMWERDRIHEAGILMSLGIRKGNILLQHFCESVFLFLLAFILAVTVSIVSAKPAGQLFYGEMEAAAETAAEQPPEIFGSDPVDLDTIETGTTFEVSLNPGTAAAAGAIGLLIIVFAVSAAFLVVVRRDPRELLTIME